MATRLNYAQDQLAQMARDLAGKGHGYIHVSSSWPSSGETASNVLLCVIVY